MSRLDPPQNYPPEFQEGAVQVLVIWSITIHQRYRTEANTARLETLLQTVL